MSSTSPWPIADSAPYVGVVALTADTPADPGRGFAILCTAGGDVTVQFSDESEFTFPVVPGLTVYPFAVLQVVSATTTAMGSFWNMR